MDKILYELKSRYEDLDVDNKKLIIYGMGDTLELYANALKAENIQIEAYTDSFATSDDSNKDKIIVSIDAVKNKYSDALVIVAVLNKAVVDKIYSFLEEMKLDYIGIVDFLLGRNADIVLNNRDILEDEKSKQVYFRVLKGMYLGDSNFSDIYEGNQYFALPEFQICEDTERYIDCGAYIGDSLESYLEYMKKIPKKYYAIEPDDTNFDKLCNNIKLISEKQSVSRDRFLAIHAGVGEKSGTLYFDEKGNTSSKYSHNKTDKIVRILALDDEFLGEKITTIKADVETFELMLLKGAEQLIKAEKPNLAICIYHNISDMYTIIDWVCKLNLGYRIFVRHHSNREYETVMYATCR